MPRRDENILAELAVEDVIMGIDDLAKMAAVLRSCDAALAARVVVTGRHLQGLLAEMGRRIAGLTTKAQYAYDRLPGQTVMRWKATDGAGALMLEDGSVYLRKPHGGAWKFHAKTAGGAAARELVKGLPGGPWRLMQKDKMLAHEEAA